MTCGELESSGEGIWNVPPCSSELSNILPSDWSQPVYFTVMVSPDWAVSPQPTVTSMYCKPCWPLMGFAETGGGVGSGVCAGTGPTGAVGVGAHALFAVLFVLAAPAKGQWVMSRTTIAPTTTTVKKEVIQR